MAEAFDYSKMAATASRLLSKFRQGLVTVERRTASTTKPEDWPVWEPWEPEETVRQYRLDAVVRTVEYKYVDKEAIRATDQQVTCSDKMTLYAVDGVVVDEAEAEEAEFDVDLLNTLVIDGVSMTVLRKIPTPGAGTKIVHKFICRAGGPVPIAETPDGVSVSAPASGVASAGTPSLHLIVDNTAGAVASMSGPERTALLDAEVSGIAAAGEPRRTVEISGEVSGSADAGTPDIGGEFSGDANGIADVGAPRAAISVAAEVTGFAGAGAPSIDVAVDAEAGAVAVASAGPGVAIEVNEPASGISDVGAGIQNLVEVSGDSSGVTDAAAAVQRTVEIEAESTAITEAFADTQRIVNIAGDAKGVGDAGDGLDVSASVWSPDTAFGADLLVWFDASDSGSITLDGSNRVTGFDNKGALGGTATPQTANRPIYQATGLNSLPVIRNDNGVGDGLEIDLGSNLPTGDSESAMAAVGVQTANSAVARSLILWGTDATDESYRNIVGFSGLQYGHFSTTNLIGGQAWLNAAQISSYEHEPGTNYGTVNGSDLSPVTETLTITTTVAPFFMLLEDNLGLQECLVLDRLMTADEREKLHGYLAHKWGLESLLPGGHPYKSSPP